MPKWKTFMTNPVGAVASLPSSQVFTHPGKAVVSPASSLTKGVGHVISGKTHHRGREIVHLEPAFKDVRVQAISGLEAPTVTARIDKMFKDCEYLRQVADDINQQLDLKNVEIKALNRDAAIFNGTQKERLDHLESLIKNINESQDNEEKVWEFMNQLLLAKKYLESV